MTLADKLNKYKVTAGNYGDNRDTGEPEYDLEPAPEDDSLFDAEGVVTDTDFNTFLDELKEYKVSVQDHPGDRRAGLVHTVQHKGETAWYDATSECKWLS